MNTTNKILKPPTADYDDDVLYGERREATKLLEFIKLDNDSECVIYSIGTVGVDKQQWTLKNIILYDQRIKNMLEKMEISHALALQRYCWPQMNKSTFPFVCVAPKSSGKTFAHLLYIVCKSITAIPIAKTNELITSSDDLGSFKTSSATTDIHTKKNHCATSSKHNKLANGQSTSSKVIDNSNNTNCDYDDDFDFNSLGREDEQKPTPASKEDSQNDKGQLDAWGLKMEDHNEVNADIFITHPSYIIICSSQQLVESVNRNLDKMKLAAYGDRATESKRKNLPPIVRTIHVHQEEEKLALKCNEAQILVATPGALVKCLSSFYIDFAKCDKVFFDDIDLTLQLHNNSVREIIKRFIIQTQLENSPEDGPEAQQISISKCQVFMFSRKWTDLVKQFVSTVFIQKILIFASIVEAALYANIRYELEVYRDDQARWIKLLDLLKLHTDGGTLEDENVAIVCNNNDEAEQIYQALLQLNYPVKFFDDTSPIPSQLSKSTIVHNKTVIRPIYIMSDRALEFVVDSLNSITHIIQLSIPEEMLVFDQRFRLMYAHIKDIKRSLMTTIFINPQKDLKHAKELYDQISRSSTTLKSTKFQLRDLISESSGTICWRWASNGLCRLEKLSREDRFGSYCPDRHSIVGNQEKTCSNPSASSWPVNGQVRITITNLISPNEFYFWFESHRDINSPNGKWRKLESTGGDFMRTLQVKLDAFKDVQSCSIQLANFKKGRIYGIYLHQEARVDRIILVEEPKFKSNDGPNSNGLLARLSRLIKIDYSQQCEVIRVDYGVRVSAYLRNIFELPRDLASIPPQCHRGFHLGVKPTDNEPNWLYKAKKFLYDQVCVNNLYEISAWLRLNSNNCFWFENMVVSRKLSNIDGSKLFRTEPHLELCRAQLAIKSTSEPSCLNPSDRLVTLSKWHVDESLKYVQYAFLRRDKDPLDVFVLHIDNNLNLIVRQRDFNKQLIDLEQRMVEDYNRGELEPLSYIAKDVYCVARIPECDNPTGQKDTIVYTINRSKIVNIIDDAAQTETKYMVKCLDHGDVFQLTKSDLYHASLDYVSQLPFQAIDCRLADLNETLLKDANLCYKIRDLLYDFTRDSENQLVPLKSRFNGSGDMYVYVPKEGSVYMPLIALLESNKVDICNNSDPDLRTPISFPTEKPSHPIKDTVVEALISEIFKEIVNQELLAAKCTEG